MRAIGFTLLIVSVLGLFACITVSAWLPHAAAPVFNPSDWTVLWIGMGFLEILFTNLAIDIIIDLVRYK
jgi:hypothetical protein